MNKFKLVVVSGAINLSLFGLGWGLSRVIEIWGSKIALVSVVAMGVWGIFYLLLDIKYGDKQW